jgi:D-3-phosphoglycerate dehydrogenase
MMKILLTAEFDKNSLKELEDLFEITYAGWFVEERVLTEDELVNLVKDKEVFITSYDNVTRKVIEAGNKLKLIACTRANPVNIDIKAANERGVKVIYTPGRNSDTTAEFTIAMMLCIARKIPMMYQDLKNGKFLSDNKVESKTINGLKQDVTWALGGDSPYILYKGVQLHGKALGIIGYGNIGKKVGNIAKAFGMNLLIYDPYAQIPEIHEENERFCTLDYVLRNSDFITCHCSVTDSTRKLINKQAFDLMKDSAYFINISRGAIVDEEALIDALREKKISGAAVDVFESEPLDKNHPFISELDNIVVTAHIGGATWDVITNHSKMIVSDIKKFKNNEKLMYEY